MHDSGSGGLALPTLGRRLRWVMLAMLVAFGGLVVRLWQLQVMRGVRYRERTVSNVVHERYLPSIRGRILDREGVPLADNRAAFNLYATTKAFTPALRGTLRRLIGLSDEELEKIDARIATARKRKVREPVLLLEDIARDRAARVDQERFRLPELEVRSEPYRHYPQGALAAHLVGYMTQMTAEEAQQLGSQGYSSDELIGRVNTSMERLDHVLANLEGATPEVTANLKESMEKIREITANLEKGSRDVPALIRATQRGIREVRDGVDEINRVVKSLEKNPLIKGNLPPKPEGKDLDAGLRR